MSTLKSRTNVVTGSTDWVFIDDDKFDYQQELARSAFADMLHDDERNVQYEKAIEKTLKELSTTNSSIHVLDIGTGTGLLSMMAARASSPSVRISACEVFKPMSQIAKKCIEKNKFSDRIRVIDRRSTELELDKDLQKQPVNMIVGELFDTELIGEGALRTFYEASRHLTVDRKNLRIVPARAKIFLEIVESSFIADFHRLKDFSSKNISIPDDCKNLAGNSIFDLNVNEIRDKIRPISSPIEVFQFDFANLDDSNKFQQEKIFENISAKVDGRIDAFVLWWTLDMDQQGQIELSTTPIWSELCQQNQVQWREHWIHGIYFPQKTIFLKKNEKFSLYCFHDEYSLYFDASQSPFPARSFQPSIISRSSLASFNSDYRRDVFLRYLDRFIPKTTSIRCLFVGESLLLPLLILDRYPHVELIVVESKNIYFTRALKAILENSSKQLKYEFISSFDSEQIDLKTISFFVSEPIFSQAILPWENLHFYYLIEKHREKFSENCRFSPSKARFRCVALEFDNLHKIRSPVGICRGFDLTPFDQTILAASLEVDEPIEAQPLFEYSSKKPKLSPTIDLIEIDFNRSVSEKIQKKTVEIPFQAEGSLNGIAFWIDYQLDDELWLTTGLDPKTDDWVQYSKQGVHLLPKPIQVKLPMTMSITAAFDYDNGTFSFEFVDQK